ncbi:MAG TPA: flavodoxin domain-containing protein [Acidimicrobiales bacterium]|nr:flavodoxin domain-containing protein [Acidimicrobiales bacterium]
MRALVTYGSTMGGTAGLARMIGAELVRHGVAVDIVPADRVRTLYPYDAVIVGGALYGGRWHRDARRFVAGRSGELRTLDVWMFSSGPLGDDVQQPDTPPVSQVAALARRVHARGHATFGGCLPADARGVAARKLARTLAGDWRDPDQVARWAASVARELRALAVSRRQALRSAG